MTFTEIKAILQHLPDPADRLEFVMEVGKILPPIPVGANATIIRGCASRVEIYCDEENNYYGGADSVLVRGIVAIILSMVRGKSAMEIRDMDVADEFGRLDLQLGAGRMNGIGGIISFLEGI